MRLTANILYGPRASEDEDAASPARSRRAGPGRRRCGATSDSWSRARVGRAFPWLHRIRTPTLVLTGDADAIVPPINARILARRIPDAELEIVPNAGHLLLMEHAERSAIRIAGFLDE